MHKLVDIAVVGGGQAGLAMGYHLSRQKRPFVILDGAPAVGHSWRTRYDSLRLFTPAQYNSLPGLPFPKPEGYYPNKDEVADYLRLYAETFRLPIELNTRVTAVTPVPNGYRIETNRATYEARQVVIATGAFQRPYVPAISGDLSAEVFQIHSTQYKNEQELPAGPVLVVGAGNSGAQIAEELARSRQVYLSVGKRSPYLPQQFLGKDLFWWLYKSGIMKNATSENWLGHQLRQNDPLIGTDLRKLFREGGVEQVGRTESASGESVTFAGGRSLAVRNIIWATGFRPDYGWIKAPILGANGWPAQRRGVTGTPGLYLLGLPWQYTRGSALLAGVGDDAAYLAGIIGAQLASA